MPAEKLRLPQDRELLAFIFARFIDGEFTGILEGRALTYAPTLEAADFLARQIRDEIRHARMYRTLYRYVAPDAPAPRSPWLLNAIMAPLTGRMWAEHCFLDKAVGERWVLHLMQTLISRTQDKRIVTTLKTIAKDEVTHIAFGEKETAAYIGTSRFRRFYLWGLYLRVDLAMAIAYRLLHTFIRQRYSPAGAEMLRDFFFNARRDIAKDIATLLDVANKRSIFQLLAAQLIFLLRWPFLGWFTSPRKSF